eukprot:CAMPEP_0204255908 /NCGR_PEP_ID=MMETSP0468-20130131/3473_1 /ASSEMBLY_ACC=CAM_ASM_000383 /TAXON_ID=2969 /ORGANISM="Oxyrrhis marina" /LENGTH=530 /DNA_ID=CAMNT_0051229823 /DNA_START=115 /DNA_END=1708 /DNA_ORIENTATION=-
MDKLVSGSFPTPSRGGQPAASWASASVALCQKSRKLGGGLAMLSVCGAEAGLREVWRDGVPPRPMQPSQSPHRNVDGQAPSRSVAGPVVQGPAGISRAQVARFTTPPRPVPIPVTRALGRSASCPPERFAPQLRGWIGLRVPACSEVPPRNLQIAEVRTDTKAFPWHCPADKPIESPSKSPSSSPVAKECIVESTVSDIVSLVVPTKPIPKAAQELRDMRLLGQTARARSRLSEQLNKEREAVRLAERQHVEADRDRLALVSREQRLRSEMASLPASNRRRLRELDVQLRQVAQQKSMVDHKAVVTASRLREREETVKSITQQLQKQRAAAAEALGGRWKPPGSAVRSSEPAESARSMQSFSTNKSAAGSKDSSRSRNSSKVVPGYKVGAGSPCCHRLTKRLQSVDRVLHAGGQSTRPVSSLSATEVSADWVSSETSPVSSRQMSDGPRSEDEGDVAEDGDGSDYEVDESRVDSALHEGLGDLMAGLPSASFVNGLPQELSKEVEWVQSLMQGNRSSGGSTASSVNAIGV